MYLTFFVRNLDLLKNYSFMKNDCYFMIFQKMKERMETMEEISNYEVSFILGNHASTFLYMKQILSGIDHVAPTFLYI